MNKCFGILLLSSLLMCQLVYASEFRSFSSKDGRTIEAKPVAVIGDKIRLKFARGNEMNVGLSSFSDADKQWLEAWRLNFLASDGRLLAVDADIKRGRRTKRDHIGTLTNGTKAVIAEVKETPTHYEVTLKNQSSIPLENLAYEYSIVHLINPFGVDRKDDFRRKKIKDKGKLEALAPGKTAKFATEAAVLKEYKMAAGIVWTDNNSERASEDTIDLNEIVIYEGKTVIYRGQGKADIK